VKRFFSIYPVLSGCIKSEQKSFGYDTISFLRKKQVNDFEAVAAWHHI